MLSITYREAVAGGVCTYRRNCKQIEDFATIFPAIRIAILAEALVKEPIDLCYLPCLVVAAQQRYPAGVACLEREQSGECLQAVVPPIDEIAHEYVIRVRHLAAGSKQLFQIIELTEDKQYYY